MLPQKIVGNILQVPFNYNFIMFDLRFVSCILYNIKNKITVKYTWNNNNNNNNNNNPKIVMP